MNETTQATIRMLAHALWMQIGGMGTIDLPEQDAQELLRMMRNCQTFLNTPGENCETENRLPHPAAAGLDRGQPVPDRSGARERDDTTASNPASAHPDHWV